VKKNLEVAGHDSFRFLIHETKEVDEGDHLEDPGVDGRIILKWTCERLDGGHGLDQSGSG
jgi:hypothetical protein